jgi:adenylylsulfate kinase
VEVFVRAPSQSANSATRRASTPRRVGREITNLTGVQDPYEVPLSPEITVDTEKATPEECTRELLDHLVEPGYLPASSRG